MVGNNMTNHKNWVAQSKKMHHVVADGKYLFCADFKRELYEKVMIDFIQSTISKTDFTVLHSLMTNNINEAESSFTIKSFDEFIHAHSIKISKPNLSRSLKSLENSGFIEKVLTSKELVYLFKTEFDLLVDLS